MDSAANRERLRRQLVGLLHLFYLALLGEGVLRKWVMPEWSNALVFLRDPLMLAILVVYARFRPSPAMRPILAGAAFATLALMLCAGLQGLSGTVAWPVVLAGLRNYVLFVPLACAIGDGYTGRDYRNWIGGNLLLATPIALLVVLQYRAGPDATINAVPGGGNDGVFLLVADVVRPYGVFSFALGHSSFAAWMIGTALAALVAWRSLRLPLGIVGSGTGAVAIMGLLSGSRTYGLLAASVVLGFAIVAVCSGPPRLKLKAGLSACGVIVALGIALVLLPGVSANLGERQSAAEASEGALGDRVIAIVGGFVDEAAHVPPMGFGLGSGTNIAAFLANGSTGHVLAEYELTRIVQELGPYFALVYLALRWGFLAWLVGLSAAAARRGNLQPAAFIGFVAPVFLAHDITLQNTMIGIGWFSAGIVIAAARVGAEPNLGRVRGATMLPVAHQVPA